MSEPHDDVLLGQRAVAVMCCIEDERSFGGYRLEDDGLYVVPLKADVLHTLSPEERAAAEAWHPTGNYGEPALALPCTLSQLRAFVERAGLNGCIDEESLDGVITEYAIDLGGIGDSAPNVGAVGTSQAEIKQAAIITTHRLKTRTHMLDAVIELAIKKAVAPDDSQSVYAAMVKLAESGNKPAPLIGYSSVGIQYRGKRYEETGEPDTFTAKNLRDRMARAKAR
jgi:hypothetical protein